MITEYKIHRDFAQKTVLEFLEKFALGKTKTHLLFFEKRIRINGQPGGRNTVLQEGDVVSITTEEKRDFLPDNKKLDIVYEDDYLLLVNKPCHILVHPDDKQKQGTMCNIVSHYYQYKNLDYSIKYAHRLDMDTTGILIFAKDSLTMAAMSKMISTHEVQRTYLCLVGGVLKNKKGTISAPIGEDRHHNQRRRISKTGQSAVTHYEVLEEWKGYSLVQVRLETGRTHQIRVHLASMGHPLLGDALYGGNIQMASRVMLHSYRVVFWHPVFCKEMILEKKPPFDFQKLCRRA